MYIVGTTFQYTGTPHLLHFPTKMNVQNIRRHRLYSWRQQIISNQINATKTCFQWPLSVRYIILPNALKNIFLKHFQLRLPIGEKWPKHKCIHYIRENMMEIFVEHLLNLFHWVHSHFLLIFYFIVYHKDKEGSKYMQHKLKKVSYSAICIYRHSEMSLVSIFPIGPSLRLSFTCISVLLLCAIV